MNTHENATAGDFESALRELEQIVQRMESGDLSLEISLAEFEKGIHLSRRCQQALTQAQQKVEQLMSSENGLEFAPFQEEPDSDD